MKHNKRNSSVKRTDRQKLELFVKKADELCNTNLAKKGFSPGYTIEAKRAEAPIIDIKQPSEGDLKEFLVTFRHFISEDEDVYLNSIFNICHRCLSNTDAKEYLVEARQKLKEIKEHNGIHFIENNVKLSSVEVTGMYINGMYFHNDLDHQTKLDNMDPLTSGIFRFYFLSYAVSVTDIIVYVGGMVVHAFEINAFNFQEA